MKYDPDIHHRRSIRMKGYDYSQEGMYFVTICTQYRECLFGEIIDGAMELNAAGQMVSQWYDELANKFPTIQCDAFICMPNHVHFLVSLGEVQIRRSAPTDQGAGAIVGANLCVRPLHAPTAALSDIVQWFKTMTTNTYIQGVKQQDWQPFQGKLWQRNYWEHIVRNEQSLQQIHQYIIHNPQTWANDQLNPMNTDVEGQTRRSAPTDECATVGANLRVRPLCVRPLNDPDSEKEVLA